MSRRGWNQLFGGLLLIAIGVYFILHELGIVHISLGRMISTFWPVVLIWSGIQAAVSQKGSKAGWIGPTFLIALGVFFLGRNLNYIDFSFGDMLKILLPGLLIGYGIYVIFKPGSDRRPPQNPPQPPDHFGDRERGYPEVPEAPRLESSLDEMFEQAFGKKDKDSVPLSPEPEPVPEPEPKPLKNKHRKWEYDEEWYDGGGKTVNKSSFIGDVHIGKEYYTLKPTNISQFIGDTVLDLTKAQIPYGETRINISAFIGDIKVFVPNDVDVAVRVTTSSFIGDMSVLGESRSGFMSSAGLSSPDYREAGKKILLTVSVFIGDVKVNKVG